MEEWRAKLMIALAALCGGAIAAQTGDDKMTAKQKLGFVVAGIVTAIFVIPYALEWFTAPGSVPSSNAASCAAFITGIYWKKIIVKFGEFIDWIKSPWGKPNA